MKDPKLPDLVRPDSKYASQCEWTEDARCEAHVRFACGGPDPHDNGSCVAKLPCSEDICSKREPAAPPSPKLPPAPTADTPAAPPDPPIIVQGVPSANHSIRARAVDLGLLLLLAADHQGLSVAALGATRQVSADLHYDDGSALLAALETVGGLRRISNGLKTRGVAWWVPNGWPDPNAKVSLGGRQCERVDMEFLQAPLPRVFALFSDIMGTKLSGDSGLGQLPLTLRARAVRCDRLLADILHLSGNSATLEAGQLTIDASSRGSDPTEMQDTVSECPEQVAVQSTPLDSSETGLHCNRVDQVRLAAVAYDKRTQRGVAAIIPTAGRPGRHALVRVGSRITLRGADGGRVDLRVTEVATDQVVVAGSQPSLRYAFDLSFSGAARTLAPLPARTGPSADAAPVDVDCILDPNLPRCSARTPQADD